MLETAYSKTQHKENTMYLKLYNADGVCFISNIPNDSQIIDYPETKIDSFKNIVEKELCDDEVFHLDALGVIGASPYESEEKKYAYKELNVIIKDEDLPHTYLYSGKSYICNDDGKTISVLNV